MKVYVAIGGYDYEGYSEPLGVFTTRELAEKAFAKVSHRYDDMDVFEYEIDDGIKQKKSKGKLKK